ncbi:NAD-dependent succinate-semialdehyde dehydrogenase [Planctomicrobium sp. SH664]|uniref:NAD-dependent succinate-semialdehyde dehydrogenase n=1 Tax=Planctomicrobium sp. SH664 TaxID=3448125 RepID=UPI003F5B6B48
MSKVLQSINPATEALLATYPTLSSNELRMKLEAADSAYADWSRTDLDYRRQLIGQLAERLRQETAELAHLITSEMGKPIAQAQAEIEKCAVLCDYYRETVADFLRPQRVFGNKAARSSVRFDPLGPVLAVMPWNFPFWQVLRFAVPGLLAGNVGLLKHAANVSGSAVAIEQLFEQSGFPPGVFTTLLVDRNAISEVIAAPQIRAVTLTGSEGAGRAVAQVAGQHLKKCVLELGGSDPFIVLADADLDRAISQAVQSRTLNNGQSCIAAKRFLVDARIASEFIDGVTETCRNLKIGDPTHQGVQMGPLAREDLRETLHEQVLSSVHQGAKLTTGGSRPDREGWFYEPTVLTHVTPEMTAFQEETFGPVMAVTSFRSVDEALAVANRSSYGLGASLWTDDVQRAEALAASIQSGCVFINDFVKSDPSLPFGGVKNSGYGRELGEFGIREFVNIKTVWVGT